MTPAATKTGKSFYRSPTITARIRIISPTSLSEGQNE